MSATDSDNSIDWLASDNEENESDQESDRKANPSQTEASPSSSNPGQLRLSEGGCRRSGELKEGDGKKSEVREVSRRGSPGCVEKWDRGAATGLCKKQQGEKANGRNSQQPLKRPHSSTEEQCKERQLISNASEKGRIFSSKVSSLRDSCLFSTGKHPEN